MAIRYVRSGAGGTPDGLSWSTAWLSLAAAISGGLAAGDIVYESEDHAESTATALTLAFPGTVALPNQVICANHSGSVPPVEADIATTATVSTTGASNISISGHVYFYGTQLQAASTGGAVAASINLGTASGNAHHYVKCVFRLLGTSNSILSLGNNGTGTYAMLEGCSTKFAAAGSFIQSKGRVIWQNTPSAIDAAGTLPTTLIQPSSSNNSLVIEGVDLSALASKALFSGALTSTILLKECKIPSIFTIAATGTGLGAGEITLIRCDSGAVNYRNEKHNAAGDLTTETTVVRSGGASDGTTTISWKIATTANCNFMQPFTALPISIWNDTTGSTVNVTVFGTWATGAAVPNNDDIWIDVEYLGSSASPLGSFVSSSKATILSTNAACTSDASSWGGTPAGGGTPTVFKMTVAITPQMKGPITVYVRCAKTSATAFYVDPAVVLS